MSKEISVPAAAEEIQNPKKKKNRRNKAKRAKKTPLQLVPAAPLPHRGGGPPRTADRAAGAAEGRVEEDQDQDLRDQHRVGRQ